jgi:hypothetical protein
MHVILPSKVELVKGRRLPILTPQFTVLDRKLRTISTILALIKYNRILATLIRRGFKITEQRGGEFRVEHCGDLLQLKFDHLAIMANEWKTWSSNYLPSFSLDGKAVLDVGAGCGETAHFYFLHGAKKVIAIEPDESACSLLKANAKRNHWHIDVIEGRFRLNQLDELSYDFMKMDGEGCEAELLRLKRPLPPCLIEAHDRTLAKELCLKFNLRITHKMTEEILLLRS